MASIFLSYAREDIGAAQALAGALEGIGHSVWWDRHIKGGTQFAAEIEAELARAEAVVVLWSPASIGSPWVRDEASTARDSGRLVPATLGGAQAPMGFRQYQSVDLTGWKYRPRSTRFAAVAEAIDTVLGGAGMPERAATAAAGRGTGLLWRHRWTIALAGLLILGAAALYIYRTKAVPDGPIAMAVLPFDALPADSTNGPFAEGLAEEISGELARNPRLQLIGRTSASMFKDSDADAKTIGRKLNVAYLVDGSVRRAGTQIRVAVELIRASDGVRLWRHTYSGTIDNIFAIQDRIGAAVEAQLRASFVGKEGVTAKSLATRGDVYGYYLTARTLLREPGAYSGSRIESIIKAEDLLRKAVDLDPNYAPGWALLSGAVLVQGEFPEAGRDWEEQRRLASVLADRALALAPQLAEAHYAKARTFVGREGRTEANLRGLQTATHLDPNNADAWFSLGNYYLWSGDFEAELTARRKALALEPLWFFAYGPAISSEWQYGFEREAFRIAQRLERDGDPQPFVSHMIRADTSSRMGDWSRSLAEGLAARRTADAGRRPFADYPIGEALRYAGELERLRAVWPAGQLGDLQWNVWRGRPPSPAELAKLRPFPWRTEGITSALLKLLVAHGRSREVVDLYRQRFGAPEKLQAYPGGHIPFISDATTIAIALRDVGRATEADRLLGFVRQSIDERLRRGPVPRNYRFYAALVAAAQGDDKTALEWLEKADSSKWWYAQEFALPDIAEEPAFRRLKGHPRFKTIAERQRAWRAKERREMAPMLSQLGQE